MLRQYGKLFYSIVSTIGLFTIAGTSPGISQGQPPASLFQEKKDETNQNTITLMTGGISATYAAFGQDIQSVLDEPNKRGGLRILPILGVGAGQNTMDILFLRNIDMGITQQELLEHFKRQNPTLHGSISDRIHYIAKLYNSEFHLLVAAPIKKVADLQGKKVNFYFKGSMGDISAALVFDIELLSVN